MPTNYSANSRLEFREKNRQILLPTVVGVFSLLFLSLALLSLLNFGSIKEAVLSGSSLNPTGVDIFGGYSWIEDLFSSQIAAQVSTVFLWAVIGSITYIIIWFSQNTISRIHSDIKTSEEVGADKRARYWEGLVAQKILSFALGLVLVSLFLVFMRFVLPACSWSFYVGVNNLSHLSDFSLMATAILFCALSLHILHVVLRIFVNSWRMSDAA
jgi:hypothetical protein